MITRSDTTASTALVTFELPGVVGAVTACVCGEFNDWSSEALPMTRTTDGRFEATVVLTAGRRWRFRYLLDGARWENDWAADEYVVNEFGGEDSVVDLSALLQTPPDEPGEPSHRTGAEVDEEAAVDAITAATAKQAAKKAPATKAPAKKGATGKAATTTTETPAKDLAKKMPAEKATANKATSRKPAAKKATTRKAATLHEAPAKTATSTETAEE